MKKYLAVGVLILAVVLTVSVPVFANSYSGGDAPTATCPPGFDHVHKVHKDGSHDDGSHPEGHKHVGNDKDQNGDDYVCVKHAGKDGNTHVHADNNYRRGQQSE